MQAVVASTVCGQNLRCDGNNLVGFNNGTNITKECQQSSSKFCSKTLCSGPDPYLSMRVAEGMTTSDDTSL